MTRSIADIRKEYKLQTLSENDIAANPISQFTKWWDEAAESNIDEINAMTLATATKEGKPSARIVLLKDYSQKGFTFFTNYQSNKGKEIAENPFCSLVFFWKELERQICIEGSIAKLSEADSDEYFNSRPTGSKIGAWSSPQSQPIESRKILDDNIEKYQQQFLTNIPRPAHWGGYCVSPVRIEFWQGRPNRLHDRIVYELENNRWKITRVAP
jgi:pyridoxamine 5'-phosphate oxidase